MCSQQTYVFYVQAYSLSEDNAEHRIDTRWDSRLKTTKHINKTKETIKASINLSRWPAKRQSSKRVVILLYRNDRMSLRYVQNEQKCNSNKEKKKRTAYRNKSEQLLSRVIRSYDKLCPWCENAETFEGIGATVQSIILIKNSVIWGLNEWLL